MHGSVFVSSVPALMRGGRVCSTEVLRSLMWFSGMVAVVVVNGRSHSWFEHDLGCRGCEA